MTAAFENGTDASYSSYPAKTHPRFMATLTPNPLRLLRISAQTMWMDSTTSEHHNSLAADNLPADTPAAAFMKRCGCSRSRSNDGHVSRAITTSSTVSFQAHLRRSCNCAVTLPGCGHAAAGLMCRQLRVFAGCLKAHQIKAPIAGSAYTKL